MEHLENYHGFEIMRPEKPVSLNMWLLDIRTDDEELYETLAKYRALNGPPAFPPGPLATAVETARAYVDAVLAMPNK
jgi:hypothetical protein